MSGKVIDYVGGQDDLQQGRIRAIGSPRQRFAEDKLRMLRAVRFAAVFGFTIDGETAAAIREMAGQITVVSPERIAMEMRRVITEPGRVQGVRLLIELGLAVAVLPEIVPGDEGELEHASNMRWTCSAGCKSRSFRWPWRRFWSNVGRRRSAKWGVAGSFPNARQTRPPG